ncbi:MAG: hypothetical protein BRD55_00345 [Bacteroidetes bacterium SW_9_63_38]|nr:MAG: hypothetical protein BRD55_00345 [Bacteroidetes bacterium SW_9_63_38]
MIITTFSLTYLGAALCYVASPASAPVATPVHDTVPPLGLRLGGLGLLALSLAGAMVSSPVGEGLLVWGAMMMAACSVLVIAAPLLNRFVPITSILAAGRAVLGLFL